MSDLDIIPLPTDNELFEDKPKKKPISDRQAAHLQKARQKAVEATARRRRLEQEVKEEKPETSTRVMETVAEEDEEEDDVAEFRRFMSNMSIYKQLRGKDKAQLAMKQKRERELLEQQYRAEEAAAVEARKREAEEVKRNLPSPPPPKPLPGEHGMRFGLNQKQKKRIR